MRCRLTSVRIAYANLGAEGAELLAAEFDAPLLEALDLQENEFGPPQNLRFGIAQTTRPDKNLKRPYNIEYNAGIDHQLTQSISVGFSYYRRTFPTGLFDRSQPFLPDNILISADDYTAVPLISPLDGTALTLYNLNPAKLGLVDVVDRNPKGYTQWYNGLETTFQVRTPGNGKLYGGLTSDRTVLRNCNIDDPNLNRFCDQTKLDIPFREMFKASGFYPLPLAGIELSGSFMSFPGAEQKVDYIVNRALLTQLTGGRTTLTQASVNWSSPALPVTSAAATACCRLTWASRPILTSGRSVRCSNSGLPRARTVWTTAFGLARRQSSARSSSGWMTKPAG